MADQDEDEPKINNKRKIDPETGEARTDESVTEPVTDSDEPAIDEAPDGGEDIPLIQAEGPDSEFSDEDLELLASAERDLVGEYRERAARAEAELKNFRTRVERDRQANRDAVIAEVIRSLLPAIDDLDRAEAHGDLTEGGPLAIVAQKIRAAFQKYGLTQVGAKGERFDPKLHDAVVRLPSSDVKFDTIADVIETGYQIGDRLIRAAKVAVSSPE
ncbi:MAG: nucleotide exchange factor GrpE [Pseudolysinimonas sp.]|uniref:nucleotide exchange factor GrpE n=1 Tax=Pseudolysinimonas sp. TaxID=2680009 RepID=UPI003264CA6B